MERPGDTNSRILGHRMMIGSGATSPMTTHDDPVQSKSKYYL